MVCGNRVHENKSEPAGDIDSSRIKKVKGLKYNFLSEPEMLPKLH